VKTSKCENVKSKPSSFKKPRYCSKRYLWLGERPGRRAQRIKTFFELVSDMSAQDKN